MDIMFFFMQFCELCLLFHQIEVPKATSFNLVESLTRCKINVKIVQSGSMV